MMTDSKPTFYVILVPKNDVYELIMKYLKVEKNLTVALAQPDYRSLLSYLRLPRHFYHPARHFRPDRHSGL